MIGFIVKTSSHGLGQIVEITNGHSPQQALITVRFFETNEAVRLKALVNNRQVLKRAQLPNETVCSTAKGECKVIDASPLDKNALRKYRVEFFDGLTAEICESEIQTLCNIPQPKCPVEALSNLHLEGLATFQKREAFSEAWWNTVRAAQGLRALLSSRIDLRPHQAYVAGTVLMDRVPRYLLADEVGLGKTIEAGIVIHDLLERDQNAKILIICPGTLTQQWLCELYAKFSSRVFRLLDLRSADAQKGKFPSQVIASYQSAAKHSTRLLSVNWDLIVVDEAHHLLSAGQLYQLVQGLSSKVSSCLLLSAIPAQHREEEYLRLLALLEPDRYDPNATDSKSRFKELYARQVEIGRKLSYLNRHLGDVSTGSGNSGKIVSKIRELASLPVFSEDEVVKIGADQLLPESSNFVEEVRALLHYVGDRYRISRRILRNRRSQLLEAEPDLRISRRLHRIAFVSEQLEIDAANAVRQLLQRLRETELEDALVNLLARHLFEAACDPECLRYFLDLASFQKDASVDPLEFASHINYESFEEFAIELWSSVGPHLPQNELDQARQASGAWCAGFDKPTRLTALIDFLRADHKKDPLKKQIIFAGFFGLCAKVFDALRSEFGVAAVAKFSWEMHNPDKEKQVSRFTCDNRCWLLVSDETGGEGRNFQFVDELIHYDLPWSVSKIEQRIGRLDRLGRRKPDVCSNVLCSEGGEDDGFLVCLDQGFQIFDRSISGLEFALSQLERRVVATAVSDGCEGLRLLPADILQATESERAEDDMQSVLDAASLERSSAEAYRRVQSTPERDRILERSFVEYLQFRGSPNAVRVNPKGYPEGTIEFRPNQLPTGMLKLPSEPNEGVRDRIGTFRRHIAQDDPNLEYFSVGNDFFDAVCATLDQSAAGRTYALECTWPKAEWRGFEFAYRPAGRSGLLASHPGLVKHLNRLFAVRLEHRFVREDLQLDPDQASLLLSIRRGLKREDKDIKWHNFTLRNGRTQLLTDRYPSWPQLVAQAETVARSAVREHFTLALASAIGLEHKRIEEQIRQARLSQSDQWEKEVAGLHALLEAVTDWDLELDFAGFFSVNGGLLA